MSTVSHRDITLHPIASNGTGLSHRRVKVGDAITVLHPPIARQEYDDLYRGMAKIFTTVGSFSQEPTRRSSLPVDYWSSRVAVTYLVTNLPALHSLHNQISNMHYSPDPPSLSLKTPSLSDCPWLSKS
jgi:hypothetical protein